MDKIFLDTYTERMLLKRTKELIHFVPYEVFAHIEQIVNEAISNHYIFRCRIEELLVMLQEIERSGDNGDDVDYAISDSDKHKHSCPDNDLQDNNSVVFNQVIYFEVVRYMHTLKMLLPSNQFDGDQKVITNGFTH